MNPIFKDELLAVYRIFKDELWRPDFCDLTWEEAVQVDVILQVLNKFGNSGRTNTREHVCILCLFVCLYTLNFRKDFASSFSGSVII